MGFLTYLYHLLNMPNEFEVGIIQLLELDRVPSLNYLLDFTHKKVRKWSPYPDGT